MTITDVTKDYTSINVVDHELEEAADIDNESDEGEYVKIYERLDEVCATDAKGTSIRILGGGGGLGEGGWAFFGHFRPRVNPVKFEALTELVMYHPIFCRT